MTPTVALVAGRPAGPFPGWRTELASAGRAVDLVRAGAVAAVVVAGPGAGHPELIRCALAHGVPICCDPPLAATAEDAAALAAAAHDARAAAVVSFPWRSRDVLRDARDTIGSGVLGELLTVDLTVHDDPLARAADGLAAAGVAAVHQLDLLGWLTRPDWTVEAVWSATVPPAAWGLGLTTVSLRAAGARARIAASQLGRGAPRFQLSVTGVRGTLLVVTDPREGSGLWRLSLGSGSRERVFNAAGADPHRTFLDTGAGASFEDAARAQLLAAATAPVPVAAGR